MNYVDLINEYFTQSGLGLGAIAEKMNNLGVKVDRSYLSKLRTGPKYPASEEVNRAIAIVTNGDPDKLVFAAFMDKAPEVVKQYFSKINDINSYLEKFAEASNDQNLKYLLGVISQNEKLELFKVIAEDALAQSKEIDFFINTKNSTCSSTLDLEEYDPSLLVKIPVLGQIAAGIPIDCVEVIEGYTAVEHSILRGRRGFALTVKGESMIGDRIHDGDTVIIVQQPEVNPSDIAVVRINKGEVTLKRVKVQDELCILSPSNPTMEPMLVPARDVEILGKVVEVKFLLS